MLSIEYTGVDFFRKIGVIYFYFKLQDYYTNKII